MTGSLSLLILAEGIGKVWGIQHVLPTYITWQKKKLENKHVGPILNEYGLLIEDEKTKRETIREMCEKLYRKCDINMSSLQSFLGSIILNGVDLISEGGVITPDEVREAISQLRKGKSPGPDGLPNGFYLSCSDMLVDLLTSAFNDGIKVGKMHASFYHGVISLIYKKGPFPNLDNWRHVTIMNVDYKILAKILANRLNDDLEKLVEKEQTCAIRGRLMWDNLGLLRDITSGNLKDEFFLISLDQKKAFDYISREYLWEVLMAYGFKQELINIIKLLYVESTVQINVNGVLTDSFAIKRGVKQGCPLSAALYILAINPLLSKIKNDKRLSGINTSGGERVVVLAYADDITIIIKNGKELSIVNEHLSHYEEISGSKLNHDKTEGVWFGKSETKPTIDINDKDAMTILGIKFTAMYGVFEERMSAMDQDFLWSVVCAVINKLWNTRCAMVIKQESISGEVVFKQIRTELKRQRTLDSREKRMRPWHLLTL
uniref:Reverse transcriptase domain-containing protein n=1 Tax=Gadus morhua TaxID=8049 RepID=A0A8C5ATY5_GADMO